MHVIVVTHLALLTVLAPHNDGLKNGDMSGCSELTEPVVVGMQLGVVTLPPFTILGWLEASSAAALMFTSQTIGIPTGIIKEMSAMVSSILGGVAVMVLDEEQARQRRKDPQPGCRELERFLVLVLGRFKRRNVNN